MDPLDISYVSRHLAERLLRDLKVRRITRVDIDMVRAACAGYLFGADHLATVRQVEDFENATLRKLVEGCA